MNTVDPTKILSYGAIGLGFLLAFLAFTLLRSEQKRNAPNPVMVRAIYFFMLFAFLLSVVGFGSELLKAKPIQSVSPEPNVLFLHGRVEGVDGKPVEGATVSVSELMLNGQEKPIITPKELPEGEYSFKIPISIESKIKLEIDKNQYYRKQSVIIQLMDINFNPVLPKKGV